MELRHLQSFVAAAEHSSFTRAAKQLSLTQAAISQHVAALEKECRAPLFERSSRSVALTDGGKTLYDYAQRILQLVAEALRSLAGEPTAGALTGTLTVAASTVPAETLLPALLTGFRKLHPEIRETVIVSDSVLATAALENGTADVAFVGELPRGSSLHAETAAADELILVVGAEHDLWRRKRIAVEDLISVPMIVREPGSGSRRCVERALEAAGVSIGGLNVSMEMNSNDAIKAAVIRGESAAFLSRAVVADELELDRLREIKVAGVEPRRQLYLLTDPSRVAGPVLRAFLQFVVDSD